MNAPLPERANPLFDPQNPLAQRWTSVESMPVVLTYGGDDHKLAQVVGIGDASFLRRTGFKGPGAVAWLQQQSRPIPAQPNQWAALSAGGLVARLGRTEFLIEDGEGGVHCAGLEASTRAAGVYPVLRQDAALLLTGQRAGELLLQTCSIEFAALDASTRPVVLTSMVGVGVTIAIETLGASLRYRIWCDSTYGAYLWTTLVDVARDLGGGPIGRDATQAE
jgi:sarcosine oxidase, subunit gamma